MSHWRVIQRLELRNNIPICLMQLCSVEFIWDKDSGDVVRQRHKLRWPWTICKVCCVVLWVKESLSINIALCRSCVLAKTKRLDILHLHADARRKPRRRCCQSCWFGEYRTAATFHAKYVYPHTVNLTDENICKNRTVRWLTTLTAKFDVYLRCGPIIQIKVALTTPLT
jgi:hypothetical protein